MQMGGDRRDGEAHRDRIFPFADSLPTCLQQGLGQSEARLSIWVSCMGYRGLSAGPSVRHLLLSRDTNKRLDCICEVAWTHSSSSDMGVGSPGCGLIYCAIMPVPIAEMFIILSHHH